MSTLVLRLTEEQIRKLAARAAQLDKTIEEYVVELSDLSFLSREEWRKRFDALTADLPHKVPPVTDSMTDRDNLYRE